MTDDVRKVATAAKDLGILNPIPLRDREMKQEFRKLRSMGLGYDEILDKWALDGFECLGEVYRLSKKRLENIVCSLH